MQRGKLRKETPPPPTPMKFSVEELCHLPGPGIEEQRQLLLDPLSPQKGTVEAFKQDQNKHPNPSEVCLTGGATKSKQ